MIDRQTCIAIAREIDEAVAPIFAKHGLTAKPTRSKYGDELVVSVKAIAVKLNDEGVNEADPSVKAYKMFAPSYGLPEDGVGRSFTYGGKRFTVTGLATTRTTRPVQVTREDGRRFKFPIDAAKALLQSEAGSATR